MGCCGGDREKGVVAAEQRWDYINLSDFRSRSCAAIFSYMWLWFLALVAIAVFAADTFTAVKLLAFNSWTNNLVQPIIPFKISKWIFAGCIMFSTVLYTLEWLRATRNIKKGGVADSYLDPVAAVLQSIRMGKDKPGWRRFLVFAELTKSRKGSDYVALFVYFQFKGMLRILVAEGPRQVINALTLYSVARASILGKTGNLPGFKQFWENVKILAEADRAKTTILFSMLFTLVIWVFAALALLLSFILYICFLWHYIPSSDGSLSAYCRRKVEKRLERIVSAKVKKALEDEELQRRKAERKAEKRAIKNGQRIDNQRKPTLPTLGYDDEKYGSEVSLVRQDSQSTLPLYSSRANSVRSAFDSDPSLSRQPTLPNLTTELGARPGMPSRAGTQSSAFSVNSYGSNAPLLSYANSMGGSSPVSPVPPMPPMPSYPGELGRNTPLQRTMTGSSQHSMYSNASGRSLAPSARGRTTPMNDNLSMRSPLSPLTRRDGTLTPVTEVSGGSNGRGSGSSAGGVGYRQPTPQQNYGPSYEMNPVDRDRTSDPYDGAMDDYFAGPPSQRRVSPPRLGTPTGSGYTAFNPSVHGGSRSGTPVGQMPPRRDFSSPVPRTGTAMSNMSHPGRSATAPIPRQTRGPGMPGRSATTGPALPVERTYGNLYEQQPGGGGYRQGY